MTHENQYRSYHRRCDLMDSFDTTTDIRKVRAVYLQWRANDLTAWLAMKAIQDILEPAED